MQKKRFVKCYLLFWLQERAALKRVTILAAGEGSLRRVIVLATGERSPEEICCSGCRRGQP